MSTVTPNVRYVSLFAAAQYWRHEASQRGLRIIDYRKLLRRLEALIALSCVRHHDISSEVPRGVVGRTFADSETSREYLMLDTGLSNPPYNIYRGTLKDLGLFDLSKPDDPLFEGAIPLGQAWDASAGGWLGDQIRAGSLPESVRRDDVDSISSAFCLCRVPDASEEQTLLVDLLFGLRNPAEEPNFDGDTWNYYGARVASWRLLLEVIEHSPGRRLTTHYLMGRLLEPDLLGVPLGQTLRDTLFLWRWVAARSLIELGWTLAFNQSFDIVRSTVDGLSHVDLAESVREQCQEECGRDDLAALAAEARANCGSENWIAESFEAETQRSCVLLMICGAYASGEDLDRSGLKVHSVVDSEGDIPFRSQRERIAKGILSNTLAAEYWSETACEALVQHTRIVLRKMAQGNPDTQHVEYEDGRWHVPPGRDIWNPRPSSGFSRLDIALGWLRQLRMASVDNNGSWRLTEYGQATRRRCAEVYRSWA
ncbi:MAG: hypothetical protein NTZ04_01000 [Chloroflexi bacterium]|nr:hypothetical protein [Chloroflexota bacterium]